MKKSCVPDLTPDLKQDPLRKNHMREVVIHLHSSITDLQVREEKEIIQAWRKIGLSSCAMIKF